MNLVDYYYEFHYGCYPLDSLDLKERTKSTIEYLKDAGFSNGEIISIIENAEKKPAFNYYSLPDSLWEYSLLERDVFYFHSELQIKSPAPIFNSQTRQFESSKFYLEMKIKYTEEDVLSFYYSNSRIPEVFKDKNKDIGSIKFLLNKYRKIDFMKSIDFLLYLIEYSSQQQKELTLFEMDNLYSKEVYDLLKERLPQSPIKEIVFR